MGDSHGSHPSLDQTKIMQRGYLKFHMSTLNMINPSLLNVHTFSKMVTPFKYMKQKYINKPFPYTSKTRGQSLTFLQAVDIIFLHNTIQLPGYIHVQSALAPFLILFGYTVFVSFSVLSLFLICDALTHQHFKCC